MNLLGSKTLPYPAPALRWDQRSSLLALWVGSMIGLPILVWTYGVEALPYGVGLSVGLQTLAVLAALRPATSWSAVGRLFALVGGLALGAEILGSRTGVPFGAYSYTEALQPQLLGVPLMIPFAWFMMLPPSWCIARRITGRSGPVFVLVSAAAFTSWDLFLDPQMVHWQFWSWSATGGYFGIPWTNYLGWFAVSALITALARPRIEASSTLAWVFWITWALESIGLLVFWGLPGPALVGMLGMGVFVWASTRKWNTGAAATRLP